MGLVTTASREGSLNRKRVRVSVRNISLHAIASITHMKEKCLFHKPQKEKLWHKHQYWMLVRFQQSAQDKWFSLIVFIEKVNMQFQCFLDLETTIFNYLITPLISSQMLSNAYLSRAKWLLLHVSENPCSICCVTEKTAVLYGLYKEISP